MSSGSGHADMSRDDQARLLQEMQLLKAQVEALAGSSAASSEKVSVKEATALKRQLEAANAHTASSVPKYAPVSDAVGSGAGSAFATVEARTWDSDFDARVKEVLQATTDELEQNVEQMSFHAHQHHAAKTVARQQHERHTQAMTTARKDSDNMHATFSNRISELERQLQAANADRDGLEEVLSAKDMELNEALQACQVLINTVECEGAARKQAKENFHAHASACVSCTIKDTSIQQLQQRCKRHSEVEEELNACVEELLVTLMSLKQRCDIMELERGKEQQAFYQTQRTMHQMALVSQSRTEQPISRQLMNGGMFGQPRSQEPTNRQLMDSGMSGSADTSTARSLPAPDTAVNSNQVEGVAQRVMRKVHQMGLMDQGTGAAQGARPAGFASLFGARPLASASSASGPPRQLREIV